MCKAMKKIYISGPMSGIQDNNFPAFNSAAEKLRAAGFFVVNPAEITAKTDDYNDLMRQDIKALCDCDAIALLQGWEKSNGAHLELHIAHRVGIEVLHVDDLLCGRDVFG